MEDTTNASLIIDRLKSGTGANSDTDLARKLGVGQQSVSNARTSCKVPDSWIRKAAEMYNLSANWLLFGEGPMRRDGAAVGQPTETKTEDANAARIKELEAELAKARQEAAAARDAEREAWREANNAYRLAARYLPPPVGVVQEPVPAAYGENGTDPARTPPPQAPHKRPDEGC